MAISANAIGDASISQPAPKSGGRKVAPKRKLVALGDRHAVPEPR
jgi:hypothetical protein